MVIKWNLSRLAPIDMGHVELINAVQFALDGDWERSHQIAQRFNTAMACWIHAVLHKIEGDETNSRYWYARTAGKQFEDFLDATTELKAIYSELMHSSNLRRE